MAWLGSTDKADCLRRGQQQGGLGGTHVNTPGVEALIAELIAGERKAFIVSSFAFHLQTGQPLYYSARVVRDEADPEMVDAFLHETPKPPDEAEIARQNARARSAPAPRHNVSGAVNTTALNGPGGVGVINGPPPSAAVRTGAVEALSEPPQTRGHGKARARDKSVTFTEISVIPESERPELLTPEQMAAVLNVSRDTLDRWSWIDGCPVLRDGHVVRFWWRDMVEWVKKLPSEQLKRSRSKAVPKRSYRRG